METLEGVVGLGEGGLAHGVEVRERGYSQVSQARVRLAETLGLGKINAVDGVEEQGGTGELVRLCLLVGESGQQFGEQVVCEILDTLVESLSSYCAERGDSLVAIERLLFLSELLHDVHHVLVEHFRLVQVSLAPHALLHSQSHSVHFQ